jgi:hypothetical protein
MGCNSQWISELAQFDIKEAHDKVITHINHSKKKSAKRNTILFSKTFFFDGLTFLNVLENQLSEWDQIQLLEILQRK